ncbi:MAG: hypothetical protein WCO56_28005 [Verrucomicrobiota bacterium]
MSTLETTVEELKQLRPAQLAAAVAGLSQAEFLRELGQRRIPLHYGD